MIVIVITIVIIIVISSIYQLLNLISDSSRLTWKGTQRDLVDEWRYSNVAWIWKPHGSERFVQLLKLKTMVLPWFFHGFTKKDMVWPWFYHGVTSGLLWTFRIHHGFDKTSSVLIKLSDRQHRGVHVSLQTTLGAQLGSRLTQETMQFVGYIYIYIFNVYIYIWPYWTVKADIGGLNWLKSQQFVVHAFCWWNHQLFGNISILTSRFFIVAIFLISFVLARVSLFPVKQPQFTNHRSCWPLFP